MRAARILLLVLPVLFNSSFQKSGRKPAALPKALPPAGATVLTPFAEPLADDETVWLEVDAVAGDRISTLLTRYDCDGYACDLKKFLALNRLTAKSKLRGGHSYLVPVKVVPYNGVSIRTTLKTNDLKMAMRVQAYNKAALAKRLRDDDFVKSRDLWVPYHEVFYDSEADVSAGVPLGRPPVEIGEEKASLGGRVFPIFGEKYQKTPLLDQRLKGRVFYLVSGHGGPDSGAEGKRAGHNLCEDEYAYDVTLRLLRLLISHGASAYMLVRDDNDGIRDEAFLDCDKDERLWGGREIPLSQRERLFQRSDLLNELTKKYDAKGLHDQTFIEIHVDSRSRNKLTDVFFYYRNGSSSSEQLAKRMHNTFRLKYLKVRAEREYEGTVTTRSLHMLRETIVPTAVYIELANIRNERDQQRLVIPQNRQAVANWLAEALLAK